MKGVEGCSTSENINLTQAYAKFLSTCINNVSKSLSTYLGISKRTDIAGLK